MWTYFREIFIFIQDLFSFVFQLCILQHTVPFGNKIRNVQRNEYLRENA